MLDDLETINWKEVRHPYCSAEKIPRHIRRLLSEDPAVRRHALSQLVGHAVVPSTPLIIPFLVRLLDHPEMHERELLPRALASVGAWITYPLGGKRELSLGMIDVAGEPRDIAQKRLDLQAYDALEAGLDTYFALLHDRFPEVREAAATLLGTMQGSAEAVAAVLAQRLELDQVREVQLAVIRSIRDLSAAPGYEHHELKDQYRPFFEKVVQTSPNPQVRLTAALAFFDLATPYTGPARETVGVLLSAFLNLPDTIEGWRTKQQIIKALAQPVRSEPLLELLKHPDITPRDAHLIARGMLKRGYATMDESHWSFQPNPLRTDEIIYSVHRSAFEPGSGIGASMLQKIIGCDKFWQIPTNLFSVFYGLPDSRDGLRGLLQPVDKG